jgi:hypothetical protein
MTYCAGWKYSNSVYLFADSAATKNSPPTTTHSSFGELHAQVRGEHVEESLLKIIPLSDGIAVAFAGDVQLATSIIAFLRENLEANASDLRSLLSSITTSLGPFPRDREVGLLLAASGSLGEPQLLYWNTVTGLDASESDYYQIGSLTSYHSALTPQVLSLLDRGNLAPDRLLSVLTAVVQSYGVHDNLIEQNIGGLIFGLRTYAGQTIWQEDTNYVLYLPQVKGPIWVSAFVRDNVVVLSSSQTNDIRCLAHSVSTPSIQAWIDKWQGHVKSHLETDRYRYWVFISMLGKVITVLRRDNLDGQSRYVSLRKTGDGKFDMGISGELMSLLKQPLTDMQDGSLPFRLNFRND